MSPPPAGSGGAAVTPAEGFDPVTGFCLGPRLAMRLRDALAHQGVPIIVGTCRISNWAQCANGNAGHGLRVLMRLGDALRESLPFPHTLARTGASELCFLLPNAGSDPTASAKKVLAHVGRLIASDPSANLPVPVEVVFGWSEAPRDGADARVLLRAARQPRLRVARPSPKAG